MERYAAPPGLRAEADRIFADSGLDYGTVDFLFGDERDASFYVCEMNACPGFEALEALGSVDAAEAILGSALTAGGQS
jgi:glutathione synthase/RimK-type ligase-like ATP-grasp enzyme